MIILYTNKEERILEMVLLKNRAVFFAFLNPLAVYVEGHNFKNKVISLMLYGIQRFNNS